MTLSSSEILYVLKLWQEVEKQQSGAPNPVINQGLAKRWHQTVQLLKLSCQTKDCDQLYANALHRAHLRCSYFQTPSSCPSGGVKIWATFAGSWQICCWMNCCTTSVLSISSNGSSGHRLKSCGTIRTVSAHPEQGQCLTLAFVPGRFRRNIVTPSAIFMVIEPRPFLGCLPRTGGLTRIGTFLRKKAAKCAWLTSWTPFLEINEINSDY